MQNAYFGQGQKELAYGIIGSHQSWLFNLGVSSTVAAAHKKDIKIKEMAEHLLEKQGIKEEAKCCSA